MRALPTYELGPGQQGNELVLNVILYGMVIGLLLSMAWVILVPMVQTYRDRRRSG